MSPFIWRRALDKWNPAVILAASCFVTLLGALLPAFFVSAPRIILSTVLFGSGMFIAPSSVAVLVHRHIFFRASNRTHWCWMDRGQCRINKVTVFWGGFARRGFRSGAHWTWPCFSAYARLMYPFNFTGRWRRKGQSCHWRGSAVSSGLPQRPATYASSKWHIKA